MHYFMREVVHKCQRVHEIPKLLSISEHDQAQYRYPAESVGHRAARSTSRRGRYGPGGSKVGSVIRLSSVQERSDLLFCYARSRHCESFLNIYRSINTFGPGIKLCRRRPSRQPKSNRCFAITRRNNDWSVSTKGHNAGAGFELPIR